MNGSFAPRVRRRAENADERTRREPPRRSGKLVVGAATDPAEAEADRLADAVMAKLAHQDIDDTIWPSATRIHGSTAVRTAADSDQREADPVMAGVMRTLASAVVQRDEPSIHRSVGPAVGREGGPLDADTEARIQRSRGGGSQLPDTLRRSMENSFGADFGRVRLHTGPSSVELNRSLQSRAFTIGGDIFFARNQYQPESEADQALLAHELTHTIQQGASRSVRVQRALVDGDSQDQKFTNSGFPAVSNTESTAGATAARHRVVAGQTR
jgi:hypothetical protein